MSLPILTDLVGVFLLRRRADEWQVLILRRNTNTNVAPSSRQIIYGHIKDGENAEQAALREVYEETGLRVDELFTLNETASFYDATAKALRIVPFFAAVVKGECEELFINPAEHSSAEWLSIPEALAALVWYAQRRILIVLKEILIDNTPHPMLKLEA